MGYVFAVKYLKDKIKLSATFYLVVAADSVVCPCFHLNSVGGIMLAEEQQLGRFLTFRHKWRTRKIPIHKSAYKSALRSTLLFLKCWTLFFFFLNVIPTLFFFGCVFVGNSSHRASTWESFSKAKWNSVGSVPDWQKKKKIIRQNIFLFTYFYTYAWRLEKGNRKFIRPSWKPPFLILGFYFQK